MSVPKRIFQTWKSKDVVPENFAYWRETFVKYNPQYENVLWDDLDNRSFVQSRFPWFLKAYDSFPAEIYRADAVRCFYLYTYGGVYVDMDTECLRPLDKLLGVGDVIFGRMGTDPNFAHSVPNAIMLSKPYQEFWLLLMSFMMDAQPASRPEFVTGPVALKRAVDKYAAFDADTRTRLEVIRRLLGPDQQPVEGRSHLRLLPGHVLYPLDWNDQIHNRLLRQPLLKRKRVLTPDEVARLFPRSHMVTYWAHSWEHDPTTA